MKHFIVLLLEINLHDRLLLALGRILLSYKSTFTGTGAMDLQVQPENYAFLLFQLK